MSEQERRSAENGIWLCQNHSKEVDNNPTRYSVLTLCRWKYEAEAKADRVLQRAAGDTRWALVPSDAKLFRELLAELPSTCDAMTFLRSHDLRGAFWEWEYRPLRDFLFRWSSGAEFRFSDPEMEGLRARFVDALEQFCNTLSGVVFPWPKHDPTRGMLRINNEMRSVEDRRKQDEIVARLHVLAADAFDAHQGLIAAGMPRLSG